MQEKLYPIDLPPGLKNNGTKYQAKDRWYKGNHVRFYQGNKQPTGGWVERTKTGATISGTPNAAVSWEDNSGSKWLAIGTTSNLYVLDSSNVVYDITPSGGLSANTIWQLDTFGQYLVGTYNPAPSPTGSVICYWALSTGTPAQDVASFLTAPYNVYGVFSTPERFLVGLRGNATSASISAPAAAVY